MKKSERIYDLINKCMCYYEQYNIKLWDLPLDSVYWNFQINCPSSKMPV